MKNIEKLLNKHNINLVFVECECDGFTLPDAKAIMVSSSLDEKRLIEVVLHEIKHLISHKEYAELYKRSFVCRSKMEAEANEFAINTIINTNEGEYNFSNLIENYSIGIGYDSQFEKMINCKYHYPR